MTKAKQPHHRGTHQARARKVVAAANANPATICWRCGRTLAAHPRHANGRRSFWTAGHVITGQRDGELKPEASWCNFTHGARLRAAAMRGKPMPRRVTRKQTSTAKVSRTW